MSDHTPGPWETTGRFVRRGVVVQARAGKADICECYQDAEIRPGSVEANARLIAAAPDLLEAAKYIAGFHDSYCAGVSDGDVETANAEYCDCGMAALDAAITKAEGRQ